MLSVMSPFCSKVVVQQGCEGIEIGELQNVFCSNIACFFSMSMSYMTKLGLGAWRIPDGVVGLKETPAFLQTAPQSCPCLCHSFPFCCYLSPEPYSLGNPTVRNYCLVTKPVIIPYSHPSHNCPFRLGIRKLWPTLASCVYRLIIAQPRPFIYTWSMAALTPQ